jgi:hypothetical protein
MSFPVLKIHYTFAQHDFAQRGFDYSRLKMIKYMVQEWLNAQK